MDPRRRLSSFMTGGSASRQRVVFYLLSLVALALLYTAAYMVGMAAFENDPRTVAEALNVVVQTFTTVGYGQDAPGWTTWQMQLLMVGMQVTGVALVFLALPVFFAPWLEERLSTTVPTAVELDDHVIVCGYTPREQALIDELETRDRPYVVVEPDRGRATELYAETDLTVIHGDPESEETLAAAGLTRARAVVADIDDETNASIALAVRNINVPVLTFVEDEEVADYHRYAGADEVFLPRQLIGESLARKVTAGVKPELDDAVEIGEEFDIVELPVQAGSELAGVTVAESGVRERTGTNIIGAWFRGEFLTPPPPDAHIDAQTILLVAGREDQLEQLKELTLSERRQRRDGRVIVAGYGEVGSTVAAQLESAGLSTSVVDLRDAPGVDVVGDVTDVETLREAGIEEASTVILALADDTETVFATLVVREIDPNVEVIARADATESVGKLYRAGADYVLALATVAGRMLASTVLDEEVISFDIQVELVRMDCGNLAGRSLAEADVRARTGVTVLAVERNGERLTDLGPDFVVEEDDALVVAGTDEDINQFAAFVE